MPYLALYMLSRRFTSWFLLGYLALLLNLGQSMHHAEIFGFHVHDLANVGSQDNNSGSSACCCHHHSGPHEHVLAKHKSVENSDSQIDVDTNCSDCILCDYFDHFSALEFSCEFAEFETRHILISPIILPSASSERFVSVARGPPTV